MITEFFFVFLPNMLFWSATGKRCMHTNSHFPSGRAWWKQRDKWRAGDRVGGSLFPFLGGEDGRYHFPSILGSTSEPASELIYLERRDLGYKGFYWVEYPTYPQRVFFCYCWKYSISSLERKTIEVENLYFMDLCKVPTYPPGKQFPLTIEKIPSFGLQENFEYISC